MINMKNNHEIRAQLDIVPLLNDDKKKKGKKSLNLD